MFAQVEAEHQHSQNGASTNGAHSENGVHKDALLRREWLLKDTPVEIMDLMYPEGQVKSVAEAKAEVASPKKKAGRQLLPGCSKVMTGIQHAELSTSLVESCVSRNRVTQFVENALVHLRCLIHWSPCVLLQIKFSSFFPSQSLS